MLFGHSSPGILASWQERGLELGNDNKSTQAGIDLQRKERETTNTTTKQTRAQDLTARLDEVLTWLVRVYAVAPTFRTCCFSHWDAAEDSEYRTKPPPNCVYPSVSLVRP